jgi:ORF6N domain
MPKKQSAALQLPVPVELIERRIYVIRGHKVMLDRDLAGLYEVTTGNLNLAVRRNRQRFPGDFMFQLTPDEHLILQSAIPNSARGGSRYPPYAFTEHGVAMLSSVLHSERAVQMNILIIRAFMKLRALVAGQTALARRIEKIEATQKDHGAVLSVVVNDIETLTQSVKKGFRRLSEPRRRKTSQIGFVTTPKSR